ncbi:MAG: preprotein translocase subunit SecG [Clostridia bacterium]|nr:preprotein translocase subunit SecG [Clostridia bacterium]
MAALLVFIQIFLIFSAIVLIVSVLMQQGNSAGLGEIGGGAETFLGKNKAKSYEGKLELATKVSAAVFVVLAILMTALQ